MRPSLFTIAILLSALSKIYDNFLNEVFWTKSRTKVSFAVRSNIENKIIQVRNCHRKIFYEFSFDWNIEIELIWLFDSQVSSCKKKSAREMFELWSNICIENFFQDVTAIIPKLNALLNLIHKLLTNQKRGKH